VAAVITGTEIPEVVAVVVVITGIEIPEVVVITIKTETVINLRLFKTISYTNKNRVVATRFYHFRW
jgi:hypothetical protein